MPYHPCKTGETELKARNTHRRGLRGSLMADAPLAIWFLIIGVTLPLIDLVMITVRSGFLIMSARDAAHVAARCKSFQTPVSADQPSVVGAADAQARFAASRFSEITVNSVESWILITDLDTEVTTRQNTRLTEPADTNEFVYQIEVIVRGQANPLVRYNAGIFGNIPGLTAPVPVNAVAREFAEFPGGLDD